MRRQVKQTSTRILFLNLQASIVEHFYRRFNCMAIDGKGLASNLKKTELSYLKLVNFVEKTPFQRKNSKNFLTKLLDSLKLNVALFVRLWITFEFFFRKFDYWLWHLWFCTAVANNRRLRRRFFFCTVYYVCVPGTLWGYQERGHKSWLHSSASYRMSIDQCPDRVTWMWNAKTGRRSNESLNCVMCFMLCLYSLNVNKNLSGFCPMLII